MKNNNNRRGLFNRFLDFVERAGNKLPHPVTLFIILALLVIVISAIAASAGVQVSYERFKDGQPEMVTVTAVNLLTVQGIRQIFSEAVKNFTSFAPLGTVLVAMLGVGVAEGTGLIQASLKKLVLSTPRQLVTFVVVFAGVMSNIASDAGYVVLVPLGALVFLSFDRHPLAGLAAAFAGVSGGFSANLLVSTLDPLLAGISQEAARMFQPGYVVNPTDNYYFMAASTILISLLGTWVTERIVEPRLGIYEGEFQHEEGLTTLTPEESKGLKWAGITLLIYVAAILAMVVPPNGLLRSETGEVLKNSAFINGLVPIIAFGFMLPGIAYGMAVGSVKSDKDVASIMSKGMSTMGGYIVLAFFAAQFVSYFSWSNLGIILAVKGANFLKAAGMTGIPLMIGFILVSAFINLFIGSASAKWAIMAPVFVPMFMALGYSPAFTQLVYRIGDSSTNIITPLMSYFAVIVAFAQKYDKNVGIGTLISAMLPYSIMFLVGWTILMVIWFILGLPIGPGAYITL
ncbi:aminobenzoyl-glutamate transport protein [Thermosediminibacter litoriperuensis]|uniref:Aminobenzoyl-glutamate transport protein n=1 Tax=Thermosediminibacter litoriperuensis TaxID=291989 RepID=A0A5S5AQB1_9FIRM|nr:AbgT family transporter [Thermosediminibacter litoriperuensis]TYP54207.1 aminobenzoyl-glutamate transport protein [Thermosediminibacter litoriperuensis]